MRRRHDDDLQIGPRRFLQPQRARERDVAIEMPLVKFVEENRADVAQLRILDQLTQQDAFRDEADARAFRDDVLEADLVSDFVAEPAIPLRRHARRKQPRREPTRLQNHDLAIAEQAVLEQDLRNLRRLSGASRRLQNEPRLFA